MDRRRITETDLENAKRLRRIWKGKKGQLGLTQAAAGKKLGVTQSMISQLLSGHVALTTDHIIKWAQLLEVNPGDIAPALSTLNFAPVALRRVKVPILASMSGKPVGAFEIVEISTRMNKQLYGISVDDDSLGVYARKGATLIISQEEEPVAGDEVFVRLKLQDRHLHLVKEFVAVDASTGKALLKPLFGGEVEEYSLDAIEIMDPIVSVERPMVARPPRKRENHLTLV